MFFRAVQFELIQGHSVAELRNGSGRPLSNGRSGKETNTSCLQKLGINTAELEGAGDPVNGEHISSNAVVTLCMPAKRTTSSKALSITSRRRSFTSLSRQKKPWRSWTHSK